ncbi:MAG: CoA transferase [Dehalococcoidia bacterium]
MLAPLAGYRIADLTHWQAGPSASLLLSYLGAEVIKVESLTHIDRYRRGPGPVDLSQPEAWERMPGFHEFNAGKLSVRLNLRTDDGAELMRKLLTQCDGMIYNLRQAAIERLGLDFPRIHSLNPRLVVVSISNAGTTGPDGNNFGYATTFAALGGLSYVSGYRDMAPCEHTSWPDTVVGSWGALAMLSGLRQREETGAGLFLDVSGQEAMAWLVGDLLLGYAMNGNIPSRMGNDDEAMAPHNCYRCAGDERWIVIAVASEPEWLAFVRVIGGPAWADEPRFRTALARWRHRHELDELISAYTIRQDNAKLAQRLQSEGVAAAPSYSSAELFADPHLADRGYFREVTHSLCGTQLMAGPPWRFSATPAALQRSAPLFGEHDDYVYRDLLELSPDQVARLRECQVLY